MNTNTAINTLRSIRTFTDQPIPDDVLRAILNAGRRAGSAKNRQQWHFIVLRDPARLTALSQLGHWAGHIANANAAIALLSDHPDTRWSVMFDLGRAAQNMMLAAWDYGVASCMATIYDLDRAQTLLGFPDQLHIRGAISLGYPATDPTTRPPRPNMRRSFEDVVHWEQW